MPESKIDFSTGLNPLKTLKNWVTAGLYHKGPYKHVFNFDPQVLWTYGPSKVFSLRALDCKVTAWFLAYWCSTCWFWVYSLMDLPFSRLHEICFHHLLFKPYLKVPHQVIGFVCLNNSITWIIQVFKWNHGIHGELFHMSLFRRAVTQSYYNLFISQKYLYFWLIDTRSERGLHHKMSEII